MAWRFLLSALWCACLVPLIVHCMRVADSIVPPRPRNGAFIITAALFALLMGLPVALRALEARTILRQRVTIAEGAITAGKQRIPWSELKYWFAHRSLHGDRYLTLVTTQGPLVLLDAFDGDIHSALSHQAPVMSLDRLVAQDARTRVETRDQGDRWF